MIRFFILVGIISIYSSAVFCFPSNQLDVVHICCYSNDPTLYTPNCYDCATMVYKNALLACLNATDMPSNISYKGADCMEKNCQIEPPKPPEAENKFPPFFELLSKALAASRTKRDLNDNNFDRPGSKSRHTRMNIVQEVQTVVTGTRPVAEIEFAEPEYM